MLKIIAIATFALAAASAAQAQSNDVQTVRISVAGIDTQSPRGARIVMQRIEAAAAKVCGAEPTRDLARMRMYEPCIQEVTARTVAGLNNPHLASLVDQSAQPAAKLASSR